jgi:rRNA processing protein Krr1/Pno1
VIDAALSGIIIGKGGVNAKAISRTSGAKIYIKDHESDVTLKNVEMEGSFDQIQEASRMVRELLSDKDISRLKANGGEFKSKLCENFPKGTCTFGDRCHFAHSQGELHHPPASL